MTPGQSQTSIESFTAFFQDGDSSFTQGRLLPARESYATAEKIFDQDIPEKEKNPELYFKQARCKSQIGIIAASTYSQPSVQKHLESNAILEDEKLVNKDDPLVQRLLTINYFNLVSFAADLKQNDQHKVFLDKLFLQLAQLRNKFPKRYSALRNDLDMIYKDIFVAFEKECRRKAKKDHHEKKSRDILPAATTNSPVSTVPAPASQTPNSPSDSKSTSTASKKQKRKNAKKAGALLSTSAAAASLSPQVQEQVQEQEQTTKNQLASSPSSTSPASSVTVPASQTQQNPPSDSKSASTASKKKKRKKATVFLSSSAATSSSPQTQEQTTNSQSASSPSSASPNSTAPVLAPPTQNLQSDSKISITEVLVISNSIPRLFKLINSANCEEIEKKLWDLLKTNYKYPQASIFRALICCRAATSTVNKSHHGKLFALTEIVSTLTAIYIPGTDKYSVKPLQNLLTRIEITESQLKNVIAEAARLALAASFSKDKVIRDQLMQALNQTEKTLTDAKKDSPATSSNTSSADLAANEFLSDDSDEENSDEELNPEKVLKNQYYSLRQSIPRHDQHYALPPSIVDLCKTIGQHKTTILQATTQIKKFDEKQADAFHSQAESFETDANQLCQSLHNERTNLLKSKPAFKDRVLKRDLASTVDAYQKFTSDYSEYKKSIVRVVSQLNTIIRDLNTLCVTAKDAERSIQRRNTAANATHIPVQSNTLARGKETIPPSTTQQTKNTTTTTSLSALPTSLLSETLPTTTADNPKVASPSAKMNAETPSATSSLAAGKQANSLPSPSHPSDETSSKNGKDSQVEDFAAIPMSTISATDRSTDDLITRFSQNFSPLSSPFWHSPTTPQLASSRRSNPSPFWSFQSPGTTAGSNLSSPQTQNATLSSSSSTVSTELNTTSNSSTPRTQDCTIASPKKDYTVR